MISINYSYKTKGTCCTQIIIETDENIIKDVKFIGGCSGNTKGISKLIKGLPINEVIQKLKGMRVSIKR